MQRYQPQSFRPAFGIAAIALTALTIATMVVGPAELPPGDHVAMPAAGALVAPFAREVTIAPSLIEVVVLRDSTLADAHTTGALPKRGRRG